jgi:hypothetical protein
MVTLLGKVAFIERIILSLTSYSLSSSGSLATIVAMVIGTLYYSYFFYSLSFVRLG